MISKLLSYLKSEGVDGVLKRLISRYRQLKYSPLYHFRKQVIPSYYGVVMKKNWRDATFRFCINGSYGNFLSDHLSSKKDPFSFLDIGANQGLYSLIAAQNPNCVNTTCFEPVKSTYLLLLENIHLNKVSKKCTALNLGLGKKPDLLAIFLRENHSGSASLVNHFLAKDNMVEESVEIVSSNIFSDLAISQKELPIIVKIDVEGKEMEVIETLVEAEMFSSIDEIFYEVDEEWVNPRDVQLLLEINGFKSFKKVGDDMAHYDVLATRK